MSFGPHLPPSAGRPRVLALDQAAAAALPPEAEISRDPAAGPFDAVAGYASPAELERWLACLRPGGRLILIDPQPAADEPAYGAALEAAGFIHCLAETLAAGGRLYRGERPPAAGSTLERLHAVSGAAAEHLPFLFLLIQQTPNKPAWRREPGDRLRWQAASVLDPAGGGPALLTFSALVKAVAFLQPAVLAGFLTGVNKVGKVPAAAAAGWPWPRVLNPAFADWRGAARGPWLDVDPAAALAGDE
ncbi:MAG: hypothetical protein JNK29_05170 [Anaerolineales bacterium]|nr:hypothetical protein [Anaerolineales bacterium]